MGARGRGDPRPTCGVGVLLGVLIVFRFSLATAVLGWELGSAMPDEVDFEWGPEEGKQRADDRSGDRRRRGQGAHRGQGGFCFRDSALRNAVRSLAMYTPKVTDGRGACERGMNRGIYYTAEGRRRTGNGTIGE